MLVVILEVVTKPGNEVIYKVVKLKQACTCTKEKVCPVLLFVFG